MGFCPNCGSWVEEGDACNFCGGSASRENNNESETYYVESSRPTQRNYSQSEIRVFRENIRRVLNPKKPYIPDGAAEKLLKIADGYFVRFITDIEDTVNDVQSREKSELLEITLERDKSTIDRYEPVFKFFKETEYADIIFTYQYYGGRGFYDMDYTVSDEKLKKVPEFNDMIQELKNQGFEYKGIYSIENENGYLTQPYNHVVLSFEKKGFHFKKYRFYFSNKTYEERSNQLDVFKIFECGDYEEEKQINEEIKRIKMEYKCRFNKCSKENNYLLFTLRR